VPEQNESLSFKKRKKKESLRHEPIYHDSQIECLSGLAISWAVPEATVLRE
jgi:hypothetical protein